MVKVLLERKVKKQNLNRLLDYLMDLRSGSLRQPGYVTGETLISGQDPVTVLVISTWLSEDHWKAWTTSPTRMEDNDMIERLLVGEARTSIFKVLAEDEARVCTPAM